MIEVVLVDEHDVVQGHMEKLAAHRQGCLHRALSVYIFNARGELLLQRRAADKYHAGGQWSNTCCSHPLPGESVERAAGRRLQEEMGMQCDLTPGLTLRYRVDVGQGLTEHELTHVFIGQSDGMPQLNLAEADAFAFREPTAILRHMAQQPDYYTPWFRACLTPVLQHVAAHPR
ncbi:isopentenyl-diphosphate Delta-isomerase [Edwardsiella piscicida]|uniref:Isopentenyl-diphosphate Delta-isomerase n=3 Tax=Edwardsiella TaxID=635 RepID=A0A0H3DYW9_EDWTF|nr:isopentenyl-diphosphate Delta-isomerase [Edwardsiella piscicida]ACY86232.1 putative isopentenyldiphosphate isomerase [Edwardsiella tarda EIB202]ADM43186.1 putative isopentenyldiphosphate isomerase [Edwardsiella tarda FL6-60]AGH75366.1 putative isopentenyldiphosphate isomerase [Edwardsiella piscicida C07-087]AOP44561.1 isopentenyl-diphosphate Delta-isomerase [Edwardsiella piscicida]ARD18414.1 isopentenyl-diphosphate Delta-isomerase [Edwardsiella piscicida]